MKRILFSILIASFFVIFYTIIASVIFVISKYNLNVLFYVDFPMKLPKWIYFNIYPPTKADYSMEFSEKKAILAIAFFSINVLLYSLPIYIILLLIGRLKKSSEKLENPPSPPSFG